MKKEVIAVSLALALGGFGCAQKTESEKLAEQTAKATKEMKQNMEKAGKNMEKGLDRAMDR